MRLRRQIKDSFMKAADIIQKRRPAWEKLERMCEKMGRRRNRQSPQFVKEFSDLYRDACADLALASAYQLPTGTVNYLHSLVARAHNQLYRSQHFDLQSMMDVVFVDTPRQIFREPCVHIASFLFWGLFALAAWLAYDRGYWPTFAEDVAGTEALEQYVDMYSNVRARTWSENSFQMGFYIVHNAGIGLNCFVSMLPILPGLVTLSYNAVYLGAVFGFMFRPENGPAGENFRVFVTAHGPFELTAIVLSAGAGLKIGVSWIFTQGRKRLDALRVAAKDTIPIILCAVVLFCLAAFIEGFF
jgi:uncharacterized membrane protein SpoIIM required for sporulation